MRAVMVAAGLGGWRASTTDAARRGYDGTVAICKPYGNGGYTRVSVSAGLLPGYLAAGAVVANGCCEHAECGGGICSTGVCNPLTGVCQTAPVANGSTCIPDGPMDLCRAPYTCQNGACTPGTQLLCAEVAGGCDQLIGCNPSTGKCDYGPVPDGTPCNRSGCKEGFCSAGICTDPPAKLCPGDACNICSYDSCTDSCSCFQLACGDLECQTGACDPALGCVFENANEGGNCTSVPGGHCASGQCVA